MAGTKDKYLNVDLDYFDHPKTVRLVGLLGSGAELLPIRLWCYCGKHHAEDGRLPNYTAQEMEAIVRWTGDSGKAVAALVKVGWITKLRSGFQVHDWNEHNGHLVSFKQRAKHAATVRWDKYRAQQSSNAPSIKTPCSSNPPTVPFRTNTLDPPVAPPTAGGCGQPVDNAPSADSPQASSSGATSTVDAVKADPVLKTKYGHLFGKAAG